MEEMYHHGIRGQKWGVRRYQNKDGSLTPAGRKRADKLEEQYKKVTGKNLKKQANKPKTLQEMTDDEVRKLTNRLTLEKNYIDAKINYNTTLGKLSPQKVSLGRKLVGHIGSKVLKPAFTEAGKEILKNKLIDAFKREEPEDSLDKLKAKEDRLKSINNIGKYEDEIATRARKAEKPKKDPIVNNKSKVNDLISKTKTVNDSDVMKGQMSIDDWIKNMK